MSQRVTPRSPSGNSWRHAAWLLALLGTSLLPARTTAHAQAPDSMVAWLRSYAGHATRDAARDPLFASFVQLSVPEWRVGMGQDHTLPAAVESQMLNSTRKVQLLDQRYLTLSGYRRDGGVSQSFLWVDLQRGQTLGAMYVCFGPAGGCQRQMLIFGQQLGPVRNMSQLPPAFGSALSQWQAEVHAGPPGCKIPNCEMPAALTQLIYAAKSRRLLLHSVGNCGAAASQQDVDRCRAVEREASELDLAAALLRLMRIHTNLVRVKDNQEQTAWLISRGKLCTATGASPDCPSQQNEERAAALLAEVPPPTQAALRPPPAPVPAAEATPTTTQNPACLQRTPLYQPDPHYSDTARQARIQGSLTAQLTITPDGHVASALIETPLGYGLDQQAEQTLITWRFRPLPADCPQANTTARVTLNFHLGIPPI